MKESNFINANKTKSLVSQFELLTFLFTLS